MQEEREFLMDSLRKSENKPLFDIFYTENMILWYQKKKGNAGLRIAAQYSA